MLFYVTLVLSAAVASSVEIDEAGIGAKAASRNTNCLCQCAETIFKDSYGKIHGNCNSVDVNEAQWCYVDSRYSQCSDLRQSERKGLGHLRYSNEACATPALDSQQCRYALYSSNSGNSGFNGGNTGYNSGNSGYNSGNSGYNSGNSGYNSGSSGYNSGSSGYNSGNSGYNSGSSGYNSGNTGYNNGNSGFNSGSSGYNSGSSGYNSGNTGYNTGNSGYNSGNTGYNTGNSGYNNGNTGYNNGNTGYNNGNTGYPEVGDVRFAERTASKTATGKSEEKKKDSAVNFSR